MSQLARAAALLKAGKPLEARALIEDAAHQGRPDALLEVAHWRLYGTGAPRDPVAAYALVARAAAADPAALALQATLLAAGVGVVADWAAAIRLLTRAARRDPAARRQLALLGDAVHHPGKAPPIRSLPAPETLAERPAAAIHRALLTPAECDHLIALATPGIRPASIVDPATGRAVPHPTRRAGMTNFGPERRDPAVLLIEARLAAASETSLAQAEPLAVLRYQPGDEYRPHLDTLPGARNQRLATVLVYLSDGYTGGATSFPEAGFSVAGRRGDALVFRNLDADGRPDPSTRHAGEPVTAGVKWLASRWIRQQAYDPFTDR